MNREIGVAVTESQQIQQNATTLQAVINATGRGDSKKTIFISF